MPVVTVEHSRDPLITKCLSLLKDPDYLCRNQILQDLSSLLDAAKKSAWDKGLATMVISREAYIAEAQQQLSNNRYYHKLDTDQTQHYVEQVKTLVHTIFNYGHTQKIQ